MKAGLLGIGLAALASAVASAAPAPVKSTTTDEAPEHFHGEIDIRRQSRQYQPDSTKLVAGGFGYGHWDQWIDLADIPADLRKGAANIAAFLAVELDPAGKAIGCRLLKSSSHDAFDALACKALLSKGQFSPYYEVPGKPLPRTINIAVRWRNVSRTDWEARGKMLTPPAPPPPPASETSGWPRRYVSTELQVLRFPVLADHVPAKVKAKGVTSLDLKVDPALGITGCEIGVSAKHPALDDAACRVASALELSYGKGCDWCKPDVIPLQFVWDGKKSYIRVPLPTQHLARAGLPDIPRDPADPRRQSFYRTSGQILSFAANYKDFADLADKSILLDRTCMSVRYDATGRILSCRPRGSTGNAAVEERLCALVVKRALFSPREDVFGTPIAGDGFVSLKLSELPGLTLRVPRP